jgi:hypothetical protein
MAKAVKKQQIRRGRPRKENANWVKLPRPAGSLTLLLGGSRGGGRRFISAR